MSIQKELQFAFDVARKHGSRDVLWSDRAAKKIELLSPDELAVLTDAFRRLSVGRVLQAVHDVISNVDLRGTVPESDLARLLILFEQLGLRGVRPFSEQTLIPFIQPPEFDWSRIPERLKYLAPFAEEYGAIRTDEELLELQDTIDAKHFRQLTKLGEKILSRGDSAIIDKWLDEDEATSSPESEWVYALMQVLNVLNIQWRKNVGSTPSAILAAWEDVAPTRVMLLAEKSAEVLPVDVGLPLVFTALEAMDDFHLQIQVHGAGCFHSPLTLDWIEKHKERITETFGSWPVAAALSQISWPRVVAWLDAGPPLSRVALCAVNFCWSYETSDLTIHQPKLQLPVDRAVAAQVFADYLKKDDSAEARQAVESALAHWEVLCEQSAAN